MLLPFDRYCEEIVAQTDLLRAHAKDTDMSAPVPSCPGWNLGQLLRHVGGDHRWAETAVQTRATGPVSDKAANDLAGYADEDWAVLDPWLAEEPPGWPRACTRPGRTWRCGTRPTSTAGPPTSGPAA